MPFLVDTLAVILGYLLGSIPFGFLLVKLLTGKDLRTVESGRTGGTNAFRAAGFLVGLATALLDAAKATFAVWIARWLSPDAYIIHVLAGLAAIVGHNYSILLMERDAQGRLRFRGGAGAMPAVGGAAGLWIWSFPIAFGAGAIVFFTLGMASVATLTAGFAIIVLFAIRASMDLMPWVSVLYGVVAELLLIWALRPNIKKIFAGTERVVRISLFGWWRSRQAVTDSGKQVEDSS